MQPALYASVQACLIALSDLHLAHTYRARDAVARADVTMRRVSTLIVLGSGLHGVRPCNASCGLADTGLTQAPLHRAGGHTAEMLALTARLDKQRYSPRCYVVAATDRMGQAKAEAAEAGKVRQCQAEQACGPRPQASCAGRGRRPWCARYHGAVRLGSHTSPPCGPRWWRCAQPLRSSSPSSPSWCGHAHHAPRSAAPLRCVGEGVSRPRPPQVLVNGPGTCVPVCLAALAYRYVRSRQSLNCPQRRAHGRRPTRRNTRRLLLWRRCWVVYVESIARVDTLSLSGRILYDARVADRVFVQWPQLLGRYPRALCVGRLY
jgi:beta-1,4-N-acetylglucosaminyltransferase